MESMPGRERRATESRREPAAGHRVVERLIRRLGPKSEAAARTIQALYAVLQPGSSAEAYAALERWKARIAGAYGDALERCGPVLRRFAQSLGFSRAVDPERLVCAMQTYYAWLAKLVTRQVGRGRIVEDSSPDVFDWCESLLGGPIAAWGKCLKAAVEDCDRDSPLHLAGGLDLFGAIYQELFPKRLRHALGEYYTPGWLAEHVLDAAGYAGDARKRLIDPACGSGVFLVQTIRRIRGARLVGTHRVPEIQDREYAEFNDPALCREILADVVGLDRNPLAVLAARANYAVALGRLMDELDRVEIPVVLADSILDGQPVTGRFDYVVGNPPWIAWDHLPPEYREATRPLWQRYGLFNLSGSEARHGGGKKDLSMLMLYAAADHYLADGGRLAMLITQTSFQSKGAGDGFRRFRVGSEGAWLNVLRVDDLAAVEPFPGTANWTAVVVLEKGRPTSYPVPYIRWLKAQSHRAVAGLRPGHEGDRRSPESQETCAESDATARSDESCERHTGRAFSEEGFRWVACRAEPIDPERANSPWAVHPEGRHLELARLIGPSDYQAHLGANSGGANGVYWLELLGRTAEGVAIRNVTGRGKRAVEATECVLEPDLIYPLVRWSDVARYRAVPSCHLLLAQDIRTRRGIEPALMRARYPKTLTYLERFADALSRRAAYKRYQEDTAFYSMYNVGTYTVAPVKVVWRRMDRRINAAVVETFHDPLLGRRPVVPQETCVLIATESADEAHYLAALLNCSVVGWMVGSHSVRGGKGFGTPSILEFLGLRRFSPANPCHVELAALSRRAHAAAGRGEDVTEIQRLIDGVAGSLWGLSEEEASRIEGETGAW
jgi:hypothetical protein